MIRRAGILALVVAIVSVTVPLIGAPSHGAPTIRAGRAHKSFHPNKGKVFVAVIGNDARQGNPDSARADAVHIVGINTKTMKGGILNFPRDSWVNIPGHGSRRINEAILSGGPSLMVKTLESLTGIRIDYWVMTGFEGFRNLIDDVGRVEIKIPHAIHDPYGSGANLQGGRQRMGPLDSLAFVRTRKVLPGGDIARTTNQGRFLLALLRSLKEDVDRDPISLLRWIGATRRHTRLDLSPDDLFRLGVLATQMKAKDVGNVTVPVSVGSVGAASVVFISPSASSIYARFRKNASL